MQTDTFNLHFLLHSAKLLEERLRARLAPLNLRPRQARILDGLARLEPASQVKLAREFNVSPASMSTMTARLIDAGYVIRVVDPQEKRAHELRLTELGRNCLSDVYAAWRDVDDMIVCELGEEAAKQLAELTRELRDRFGGRKPGAQPPAIFTKPS